MPTAAFTSSCGPYPGGMNWEQAASLYTPITEILCCAPPGGGGVYEGGGINVLEGM